MNVRYVIGALALAACGSKEAAPGPAPDPASKQATPTAPVPPAEAAPLLAPNAPKDQPVHANGAAELAGQERAVAPYIEQGRKTYPDAKQRYLAGLPVGGHFFVVTWLRSPGKQESVFIAVTAIKTGTISGRIASDIITVDGYKKGDAYQFSESALTDWVISKPDGSEEGNVVGKFLDEYQKQPH